MKHLNTHMNILRPLAILALSSIASTAHAQHVLPLDGLEFDGVDDYAYINETVIPTTGAFTVCVWARADSLSSGYAQIVAQHPGTTGIPFYLGKAPDNTICANRGSTGVPFPTDGGWHHYAVVNDSTDVHLYVDGVWRHSRGSALANPQGAEFRVGRAYGSYLEYFDGPIDELSVWSMALGEQQILQTMHASLGGSEPGLVSYYQLEERVGNDIFDSAGGNDLKVVSYYAPGSSIYVDLPALNGGQDDAIEIPNGRPIYALLVSGFHQNRSFDLFHFYNFAKALKERGAYVHFSWWNNLLAPNMERPLHDWNSVPSTSVWPAHDLGGGIWPWGFRPDKAVPAEDFQFQADAKRMIQAIHASNPDAAIILVGHSFGGDSVVRLADDPSLGVDVDLLAPIDPVGNRTCQTYSHTGATWFPGGDTWCAGNDHFKRFYAVREDFYFLPNKRTLGTDIKYLYHRWQGEGLPPFDYLFDETFDHYDTMVPSIGSGSTNVQSEVSTSAIPSIADGHGEIVGFRGFISGAFFESDPVGLQAQGSWPSGLDVSAITQRVYLMRMWDADPDYLENHPSGSFAPAHPEYCMVSGELSTVLQTAVELPPKADAGSDQMIYWSGDTSGAPVILNASASSDPNYDSLSYYWYGPFGSLTGESVTATFPPGMHWVTLSVYDSTGKRNDDSVLVTVTLAPDCNGNDIPDCQEIASGSSLDGNGNGIPDECDHGGVPFCFGDGSSGACPCGNQSAGTDGCRNATGSGASLTALGTASVSADGLTLIVNGASPGEFGIFVQNTTQGAPLAFYDGLLCLSADSHLVRHYSPPGVLPTLTDASGAGLSSQPMTSGDYLGDTQPGVTVYYQFWYRDNSGPCSSGANFSSGVAIPWLP